MKQYVYICLDDCCEHVGHCNELNFTQFQECPCCGEETELREESEFELMRSGGLDSDI